MCFLWLHMGITEVAAKRWNFLLFSLTDNLRSPRTDRNSELGGSRTGQGKVKEKDSHLVGTNTVTNYAFDTSPPESFVMGFSKDGWAAGGGIKDVSCYRWLLQNRVNPGNNSIRIHKTKVCATVSYSDPRNNFRDWRQTLYTWTILRSTFKTMR